MPFESPNLPYPYDALEPHIDADDDAHPSRPASRRPTSTTLNAALDGTEWADRRSRRSSEI